MFDKDEFELVNGASAGEDASVGVEEMMADAGEVLVQVAGVERFALFV